MTTTFVIIRHGETLWNLEQRIQGHGNSALSPLGCCQANALAERLACMPFDSIVSSDLERAWQTAQAIAERSGRPLLADPGLRERNFGVFEGLTWEEIVLRYPEQQDVFRSGPDTAPPGGESVRHFHDRVIACVSRLVESYPNQRLVLVTHGGVLSLLFKYTVGLDSHAPRRFALPNAGINIFAVTDARWKLVLWGDTQHCSGLDACGEETVTQS